MFLFVFRAGTRPAPTVDTSQDSVGTPLVGVLLCLNIGYCVSLFVFRAGTRPAPTVDYVTGFGRDTPCGCPNASQDSVGTPCGCPVMFEYRILCFYSFLGQVQDLPLQLITSQDSVGTPCGCPVMFEYRILRFYSFLGQVQDLPLQLITSQDSVGTPLVGVLMRYRIR